MEQNGEFEVEADMDKVWGVISDANEFSKLLPDVSSVSINGDEFEVRFNVDIRKYTSKFMGASYLSNLNVKFSGSVKNKNLKKHVEIEGKGSAVGIKFSISLGLDISQIEKGVKVAWKAGMETGGFAKIFGEATIDEAIKTTVEQVIENIKKRLTLM